MKGKLSAIGVVAVLLMSLSGCMQTEEQNGGTTEAQMSLTEIRVGDIPTEDFSHVNVTFSEIRLHKSGNDSGWINITTDPTTVDLIYLHLNNITEQLGIEEIEIGNYTKLWIVVDNATGVLKDSNETVNFAVPSGILKIQHLFDIRKGNNTIEVDIDLDNSIVEIGQGAAYKLLPAIGALRVKYANGTTTHIRNKTKLKDITENRPPAIDVVANGSRGKPVRVDVNETITFNATETIDIEGDNISYYWDFDDGTNATGIVVTHSYNQSGNYWVVLTVSDGTDEAIEQIEIHVQVKQSGGQGNGNGQGGS